MASKSNQSATATEIPAHLRAADFDKIKGDTFGGSSEILTLGENEAAGPLTYVGHRITDLGNGLAPADIHEAKDTEDSTWRMPIATSFRRQAEGANLRPGDTFFVKRIRDEVKKNGVGKGNSMQMYVIKVTGRAAAV